MVVLCVLLLQDLLQSCARGGRRRVEDMCYERRRAEACVDESAHHALFSVASPGAAGNFFLCADLEDHSLPKVLSFKKRGRVRGVRQQIYPQSLAV